MSEECQHEETTTEVTKSAVYVVCKKCGKRLEERVVIEKEEKEGAA